MPADTSTAKRRILIAEDDPEIALLESDYLIMNGFAVDVVDDGDGVVPALMNRDYDLALLDIMLPGKSGYDICREIRDKTDIPILMVTARSESTDKIRGLGLGADDYIAKPFDPGELVARVRSHLSRFDRLVGERRADAGHAAVGAGAPGAAFGAASAGAAYGAVRSGASAGAPGAAFADCSAATAGARANAPAGSYADASDCVSVGDLRIMTQSWSVFRGDEQIKLTHREFELLRFLAENPNIVFSKDTLFEKIWGYDYVGDSATVTVHVNRIREKVEEQPSNPKIIETVWGVGYRLNKK